MGVTGRKFPHWELVAMLLRLKRMRHGRMGDGREEELVEHVLAVAAPGDPDAAIAAVDQFAARPNRFLINIGAEKGAILERAVGRARPTRLLELGTYCGYSAMRIARSMPAGAHLWSVEPNPANADVARRIWEHAGLSGQVTAVVGALGDGGGTLRKLRERHAFGPGGLDFVLIDHAKNEYLPDLRRILAQGWLHPGSVVVADNVRIPGAPGYRAFMRANQGRWWRTVEHAAHVEYQRLLPDLVLESEYLGGPA
ncbi:O-methyltransferase [Pseudonocardia eucalypti]|uniref:O-methyltransferase n=1 Tax=Pseudonocardia eucalypti TaxID=648755 RepID=A0ABP9QVJ3_9PSEU|nr:catechol O-methyltransferase [Pseudonocardia eucalypti]